MVRRWWSCDLKLPRRSKVDNWPRGVGAEGAVEDAEGKPIHV